MYQNIPIKREEAIKLLKKYNPSNNYSDWNHYLESESVMRELAKNFGENEEYWAMLGLLHDVDWAITKNNPTEHLTKAPEILRDVGFDEEFIKIIVSHGYGFDCSDLKNKKRTRRIEHCLAAAETITGLIHAYALMRNKKISDMDVKGLKKKFKDKAFASGCNREIIKEIEIFLNLDEFFDLSINAIKNIKEKVGLL